MGLMEKIKNLFTDEEIIEEEEPVKIKEIKKEEETKEHKLPTFMREKIEKEEKEKKTKSGKGKQKEDKKEKVKEEEKPEEIESPIIEEEFKPMDADITEEKQSNFKFPVFEESDFIEPTRASRHIPQIEEELEPENHNIIEKLEEPKPETKVAKLYKDKIEDIEDTKKFKASPIISPIFGVLDKNYIPSDVATRKGGNYEISRHSKNVDFDSVRKKAFESNKTQEEDIKDNIMCENCEYLKKAKSCDIEGKEKDLIEEEICRKKREEKDITMDQAEENYFDYGVSYEKKQDIDPIYLDEETINEEDNKEEVKIVNHVEEKEDNKEIPPVKSSINLLSTIKKSMGDDEPKEKNLELTDDLFNLIDSMYDEKEE